MAQTVDRFNLSDVFISYSRKDTEFVKQLDQAFKAQDMEVWVDYEDIAPSIDWWEEIQAGIEAANIFVFVITPDSVTSEICREEISHALEHGKRFLPILHRDIVISDYGDAIHPAISSHNWIYFRDEDDFDTAFDNLLTTINTDFGYLRQHTRLLVRAREWESRGWDNSTLLTGAELSEAQEWLHDAKTSSPPPSELHTRFIRNSERIQRRSQQRTIAIISAVVIFAILSTLLFFAQRAAANNEALALEAQDIAEIQAQENAALANAASLVSNAQIAFEDGDPYTALPFAITATTIRDIPIAQTTLADIAYHPGASYWLNQQSDDITDIATSSTEPIVALASRDDSIVLWNVETSERLAILTGHSSNVNSVAFSPDSQTLASGGSDGRIILWNVDGSGRRELVNMQAVIISVDYHPNGETLAIAVQREENAQRIYEVQILDVRSADVLSTISFELLPITDIIFSPDGTTLMIGTQTGDVQEWLIDADIPEELFVFDFHRASITDIDFSPNGEQVLFASLDDSISIWDYESGEFYIDLQAHTDDVNGAAFIDNQTIFSVGRDRNMIIWDVFSGNPTSTMTAHSAIPTVAAVTYDGRIGITGASNGNGIVWDLASDTLVERYISDHHLVRSNAVHPSGQILAAGLENGDLIIWNSGSKAEIAHIEEAHGGLIYDILFTPNGEFLLTAGVDCVIHMWDSNFDLHQTLGNGCLQDGETVGHTSLIPDIDINQEGTHLLSGSQDSDIILWDLATGDSTRYENLNGNTRILTVAFAQDGTSAFASSNNTLLRFDLETGEITQRYVGHAESIVAIDLSPDGTLLAASDVKRTIIIWNTETTEQETVLLGHRAPVWAVDFSSTGGRLVSTSDDGMVLVWDIASSDIIRRYFTHTDFVRSVEFSPNDRSIVFGGDFLSQLQLLESSEMLIWVTRNRIYRPLSCGEIRTLEPFVNEPLCITQDIPFILREGENEGSIYMDGQQLWSFEGEAGEVITLRVTADYWDESFLNAEPLLLQRRLDTILTLNEPMGGQFAFDNDSDGTTNSELVNITLPSDGTYTVSVGSFGGLTRGGYRLFFERNPNTE